MIPRKPAPLQSLLYAIIAIFCCVIARAQTRTSLSFGIQRNDFVVNDIPSYINVDSALSIPVEGVYLKSSAGYGVSLGASVEKEIGRWLDLRTGFALDYRRTQVTYFNDNLFFFDNNNYQSLAIDINRNFLMLQIPIGMMIPLNHYFFVDVSFINNLILSAKTDEKTNDTSFDYTLVTLDNRPTRRMILEAALGLGYKNTRYAIRIDYVRSINTLQKKSGNAYNQIIPADLYFSTVKLTFDITLHSLFSRKNKG